MKITFKLPMAEELAAALCAMSDKDAGAAFKAALIYMTGGESPALSAGAKLAFASMRGLIDLSRMKAAAGRAGGNAGSFSCEKTRAKQIFAGSTAGNTADGTAGSNGGGKPGTVPQPPNGFDVLAGLDAFLS
jgi:hypothetical protein